MAPSRTKNNDQPPLRDQLAHLKGELKAIPEAKGFALTRCNQPTHLLIRETEQRGAVVSLVRLLAFGVPAIWLSADAPRASGGVAVELIARRKTALLPRDCDRLCPITLAAASSNPNASASMAAASILSGSTGG